jgi:hypothetical protein
MMRLLVDRLTARAITIVIPKNQTHAVSRFAVSAKLNRIERFFISFVPLFA